MTSEELGSRMREIIVCVEIPAPIDWVSRQEPFNEKS
jgi:hypothetical protein